MPASLIRPLFDGPLDIVGDVHGEIDALRVLLRRLGYAADGSHPEGRRLIFVGDLVDRGPDSPAVLDVVRRLVESERAHCVLGNHELNILLDRHKPDNVWFFHHSLPAGHPTADRPEVRIDAQSQPAILGFLKGLPLALERPDVRVVHACWDDAAIALARPATDVTELHRRQRARIEAEIHRRGLAGPLATLALQNDNPVKLLTSGPETQAAQPFEVMGRVRHERRVAWWYEYSGPLCVFGHYWRILLPHEKDGDSLFTGVPLNVALGRGAALCVDYSVGKRFLERAAVDFSGEFYTSLGALRWPERRLLFDDGRELPMLFPWE